MPDKQTYIGRFAPSPTGPLHLGSLYTALASFLDAKSQHGLWLLRIDDLDTPRNIAGATELILNTLEVFGLHWDGSVVYQSQSIKHYQDALQRLERAQLIYACQCSRKSLATDGPCYCGEKKLDLTLPHAYRVKITPKTIAFIDQLQGLISENRADQTDFVIKRKDQIIAYQFAVVMDDHLQGITHVVRGYDLLASTSKQIYLQQLLGLTTPHYMHVPIIMDAHGFKLSKQTLAEGVDLSKPEQLLYELLGLLRQNPPIALRHASVQEQLSWGIAHWNPQALSDCQTITWA